jgi:hypothetical protein
LARKIDKITNTSIPLVKKEGKVGNIPETMPSKKKVSGGSNARSTMPQLTTTLQNRIAPLGQARWEQLT